MFDSNDAAIQALGQGSIDGVSSTCRPPTSSRTSSSRTRPSSVSSRVARPSTSAPSWPRTARSPACVNAAIAALAADGTPRPARERVPAVPGQRPGLRAVADAGPPAHGASSTPAVASSDGGRCARRSSRSSRRSSSSVRSAGSSSTPRAGPPSRIVLQRRGLRRVRCRASSAPSLVNIQLFVDRRDPGPGLRPGHRGRAQPARAGSSFRSGSSPRSTPTSSGRSRASWSSI